MPGRMRVRIRPRRQLLHPDHYENSKAPRRRHSTVTHITHTTFSTNFLPPPLFHPHPSGDGSDSDNDSFHYRCNRGRPDVFHTTLPKHRARVECEHGLHTTLTPSPLPAWPAVLAGSCLRVLRSRPPQRSRTPSKTRPCPPRGRSPTPVGRCLQSSMPSNATSTG